MEKNYQENVNVLNEKIRELSEHKNMYNILKGRQNLEQTSTYRIEEDHKSSQIPMSLINSNQLNGVKFLNILYFISLSGFNGDH